MNTNVGGSPIILTKLLDTLGFSKTSFGFSFDIDDSTFTITEDGFGRYMLIGTVATRRATTFVQYALPRKIDSREQGLALLAYALRHAEFDSPPAWLIEGLALGKSLPWNAAKHERMTDEPPQGD